MRLACLSSLLAGGRTHSGTVAILADAGIQHFWPSQRPSKQQLSRDQAFGNRLLVLRPLALWTELMASHPSNMTWPLLNHQALVFKSIE